MGDIIKQINSFQLVASSVSLENEEEEGWKIRGFFFDGMTSDAQFKFFKDIF